MNERLRSLQRSFQRYLVVGAQEESLSAQIRGRDSAERVRRLRVYRSAYNTRLEKALAHDFPATRTVLGQRSFALVAGEYVLAHPSRSPSLRDLGNQLAGWLAERDGLFRSDLAALEWAVHDVFDRPDTEPVAPDALEGLEAARWARLKFELSPALHLLETSSNAVDVWRSLRRDEPFAQLCSTARRRWVVWRVRESPRVSEVTHETFLALRELGLERRLENVCEALLEWITSDRIADVVARAISQALNGGWIIAVSDERA